MRNLNMKNIDIRALKAVDMPKMLELLQTREELDTESAKKRLQLMEWIAFNNPFADREPTYFIAEDQGKIVAYLGRMPMEFIVNGKRRRGYYMHDLFVNPEYRKQGLGFFLSMSLYKIIEEESKSFCVCIWTNEINLKFQRQRRYYEISFPKYVKLLNPNAQLNKSFRYKTLVKIISPVLQVILVFADSIMAILMRRNTKKVKIFRINQFDSSFDDLFQKLIPKLGINPLKKSDYLNWKFIDRPFSKTEVYAAKKNGNLKGYVVLAFTPRDDYLEGTILDILSDPNDSQTIYALLKASVVFFKEKKAHSIKCCLTDRRFSKILKKFLFLKAFGQYPLMIANLEKTEDQPHLKNIKNWHLSHGDSDNFMLVPSEMTINS